MGVTRVYDWLSGMLMANEIPSRTTGKPRWEAEGEEPRTWWEENATVDLPTMNEYEASNREPPSPSISPPPPPLDLVVGQRIHGTLQPRFLPSNSCAPATRVTDATLGYTSPVLARDTHPRLSSSSRLPLRGRHIHPPPTSSRTSAHTHSDWRHRPPETG
ncbi:hypothetical protein C8F01DRAFT_1161752 [Mycena amicta]|nr:hypothetical protein C8F01DRAFT_1161752 [Mycena amicta]